MQLDRWKMVSRGVENGKLGVADIVIADVQPENPLTRSGTERTPPSAFVCHGCLEGGIDQWPKQYEGGRRRQAFFAGKPGHGYREMPTGGVTDDRDLSR